ncbi:hypothetical protein ABL78_7671 [Leptomonas seymouri]|uniref:Uncharacterized protein n=1 Tax=Leptomonas seymouri TaxID=5684 RepID=A0A0N1I093_LEPSE|nr:hypothetical protein ABL78_7671 [Leptomonas seymouri]|eukprot:KPI83302.1 hypothetical protein ABL78_7671 [Leptomonas seymouri]
MPASSNFPNPDKQAAVKPSITTSTSRVVLPIVNLPVLSPGYPLAHNTAALEASASRYFQHGHSPYGKRCRPPADTALTATPPKILDTLCVEECAQASSGDQWSSVASITAPAANGASAARTKAYLTKLFQEPVRCEQDVYRLVDVVHCRRVLRGEEEAVMKSGSGATAEGVAMKVSAFNSCLTSGQHRRYRAVVLEWLRHQPSCSAPPDSGEVLKVVQQEQRLFLEVLRQEVVARFTSTCPSLHELLTPALMSYAKARRITQMRQQLLCFLEDAKAHEAKILLCRCLTSTSNEGGDTALTVDADSAGVKFEQEDGDADASNPQVSTLTPQQMYQRRYPSLRVLQLHMAKLYNSQQTGITAPFPNPQVQSSLVEGKNHRNQCPSPVIGSPAVFLRRSTAQGLSPNPPSRLLLSALPQFTPDNDRDDQSDGYAEIDSSNENKKVEVTDGEGVSSFAAHHMPFDSATSLPVSLLRAYVEQHLLPRFGWRPSKLGDGSGADAMQTADHREDLVESISLSATFSGLLKLFVAHLDTEEPRTSFRVPVRVHLTPISRGNSEQSTAATIAAATATARYHAHVMVGDAVPNVKESRHSVQVAAAEYLLYHQRLTSSGDDTPGNEMEAEQRDSTNGVAPTDGGGAENSSASTFSCARVLLTRSATMQNAVEQGEAAVQAAGGDRIKASAAIFLSMKEAVADAAPVLPFYVSVPAGAAALVQPPRAGNGSTPVEFMMAKMEHLNATSAGTPATPQTAAVCLSSNETAGWCPFLLESLSPREMLQLDLIFSCYPTAVVRLHRLQLMPADDAGATSGGTTEGAEDEEGRSGADSMQVLAVETLTCASWALLRQQLHNRPTESLTTSPTPAEVLGTLSWDLLYDTLAWLLDSVERRAADALRTQDASGDASTATADGDRFIYFILSNHANLVNPSASTKLSAKRPHQADRVTEVMTSTFTESRFAVRYVLQDALELYPDYEPRVSVNFEAENLNFLEEDGHNNENGCGTDDGVKGASPVALRLYRDPHTWNSETIPFTFRRKAPVPTPSASMSCS